MTLSPHDVPTNLPTMLGSIGDHAYRLAAYARHEKYRKHARAEASLLLLLMEQAAPELEWLVDDMEPAKPPPEPPPPKVKMTRAQEEELRTRRLFRMKYQKKGL